VLVFDKGGQWRRFEAVLRDPSGAAGPFDSRLALASDKRIRVVYAPLDTMNTGARVVIVGITPGAHQAALAVHAARRALQDGADAREACWRAKQTAAFAGTMRTNLIAMLDDLGLPGALSLTSSSELFGTAIRLLNSTSALRYPVFVGEENYRGQPDALRQPSLRWMLTDLLPTELGTTPDALVVPLGKKVDAWITALEGDGLLRCPWRLHGFPHPSGGNGHRVRQFANQRASLRRAVASWAGQNR
jgi:hypothetical protein